MSPNLTQLIEQSAALSPQERLELATHLQSSQSSLDREHPNNANSTTVR
jgi:hypothetical protein